MFSLRFPKSEILLWAEQYIGADDDVIVDEIVPRVRKSGFFTKDDFLTLGEWKSPRPRKHYQNNTDDDIRAITQLALSTANERLRIETLTLLNGVSWPVASVILHFAHTEPYPILDFRAIWSLSVDWNKVPYNFGFWWEYTQFCRTLAQENNVSMRTLDRALWQYSKENQH